MESRTLKFIKIAILFSLIIGVSFAFLLVFNFGNTDAKGNAQYESTSVLPVQHLNLTNDATSGDYTASNVSENYGTLKLRDFDVSTETEFYLIIVFANFSSGADDWTQEGIDKIMQYFNDEDSTNDIYSVKEYMKDQSDGKINMTATYVLGTSQYSYDDFSGISTSDVYTSGPNAGENIAYSMETGTYNSVLAGKSVQANGKTLTVFHGRILYFPCQSGSWNSALWPHSWNNQAMITITQTVGSNEGPFTGTYTHELTHLLGVPDLYIYEGSGTPVGAWYLMASTDYYYPQTINTYYKSLLGFIDTSHYFDATKSRIESIASSGTYLLNSATSSDGTIALKFGEKATKITIPNPKEGPDEPKTIEVDATEYFVVEYKYKSASKKCADYSIPETGLIVYRVVDCDYLRENGNMFPNRTSAEYQVYVFRPNGDANANRAALTVGESYGSTTSLSSLTQINLTYSDGTNSFVKVTNGGTNTAGQAVVNCEFADSLYSVTGTLSYNDVRVANARIFASQYITSTGEYEAPVDTGLTTNANGEFYVLDLKDKTKLTFVKEGMTLTDEIVINGANVESVNIQEHNAQEITLEFFANINEEYIKLEGVQVYKNSTPIAISDATGIVTFEATIGDYIEYEKSGYNFSPFTYTDFTKSGYKIEAIVALGEHTAQISVTDASGNKITPIQIIDMTNADTPTVLPFFAEGDYYRFNAYENMLVRVENAGFAPFEYTITAQDLMNVKYIQLQKYQSTTLTLYAVDYQQYRVLIPDVTVKVDGVYVGTSNSAGEVVIDKIYAGQTVTFEHLIYKIDDWEFDGSTTKELQGAYKNVTVLINFYRPQVDGDETYDPNNNIVPVDQVIESLTIRVNGTSVTPVPYDGMLKLDALYYADVAFDSSVYAITDASGKILNSVNASDFSHQYGVLLIDPTLGTMQDGCVVFNLYAKKIMTITGNVVFPEGFDKRTVSIYINNKEKAKTTTDEDGNFTIVGVIEGDEIIFKCSGFEFEPYYAKVSDAVEPITIEAQEEKPTSKIGLYILFGVLGLCFIIPFFMGMGTKSKPKLKQI